MSSAYQGPLSTRLGERSSPAKGSTLPRILSGPAITRGDAALPVVNSDLTMTPTAKYVNFLIRYLLSVQISALCPTLLSVS